jgi:hypothetical protein
MITFAVGMQTRKRSQCTQSIQEKERLSIGWLFFLRLHWVLRQVI